MKQLSRADADLLRDLREADEKLARLPEAMLEKDVFITEATLALASLTNDDVAVVFCGGTSLSKAHRVIERMSEDVDFKLAILVPDLSKNARRNLLRKFRGNTLESLKALGYDIREKEHVRTRDEGTYTSIELHYGPRFTAHAAIRPHVQIEFDASSPRAPTLSREIETLASRDRLALSRAGLVECVDVSETMAEKLISFTRRTAQFLAGKYRGDFDTALVRHLYDVHQLVKSNAIDQNRVETLARTVSANDALEFKSQHPEYHENPAAETTRALKALTEDPRFEKWYNDFVDVMIYGDERPYFRDVVKTFKEAITMGLRLSPPI